MWQAFSSLFSTFYVDHVALVLLDFEVDAVGIRLKTACTKMLDFLANSRAQIDRAKKSEQFCYVTHKAKS